MRQIEEIVNELKIDCELKRVPGYLFAAVGKDTEKEIEFLQLDASLANAFGFDADFIEKDPLFRPSRGEVPQSAQVPSAKLCERVGKSFAW